MISRDKYLILPDQQATRYNAKGLLNKKQAFAFASQDIYLFYFNKIFLKMQKSLISTNGSVPKYESLDNSLLA